MITHFFEFVKWLLKILNLPLKSKKSAIKPTFYAIIILLSPISAISSYSSDFLISTF